MRHLGIVAVAIFLSDCLALHAQARPAMAPSAAGSSVVVRPAPHGFGRNGVGRHFPRFGTPHFLAPAFLFPYDYWSFDDYSAAPPDRPIEVVIRHENSSPPVAARAEAPASPGAKLIELPAGGAPGKSAPAERRPVVFLLASGTRVEAMRYTITGEHLYIYKDRRSSQRISLDDVNIAATVEANRQNGVELRFPSGPNEIFLSF